MSCYRPIPAFRNPLTGEVKLWREPQGGGRALELPCGRCIGCRLDNARAWSVRIQHEAQAYDGNVVATLTYAPVDAKGVPAPVSLEYRHFVLFMKRLRKRLSGVSALPDGSRPVRFFVAGEYGGKTGRPHWHAVLFNVRFPDRVPLANGFYRSELCEALWSKGNVMLDDVTPESASYVAGYVNKKMKGPRSYDLVNFATGEVVERRPPFVVMSRRPGIGAYFFQEYGNDLFPMDAAVMSGGRRYKVPRFYWKRYVDSADPVLVEEAQERRYLRAMEQKEESSPERRAVREELDQRRVDAVERGL